MAARGIGNLVAPARYILFLILLPVCFSVLRAVSPGDRWLDEAALAFDVAAAVFLFSLIPLLRAQDIDAMRRHARANDANRFLVLLLTMLLAGAVMVAIGGELDGAGKGNPASIAKLVATLAMIWLFANSVFALHYAHLFYSGCDGRDCGGLDVPATNEPTYVDFFYFAVTLGMTFQTSDIAITSRPMRIVATLHSAMAFVFNLGVLAYAINVIGTG